jgi:hypothetical protein
VAPSDPQFQGYVPGQDASLVTPTSPISVTVLFGSYGIGTETITMNVDGVAVTPTFTVAPNSIVISHQPAAPFAPGSIHNVTVNLTDSNGTP